MGTYIIIGIIILLLLLLLVPIKGRTYEKPVFKRHVDERDTMFSRNEIKPGEERFGEYYGLRAEKRDRDDNWRAKPGLLSEGTTCYNKLGFAAAEASFEAVEAFFPLREKGPSFATSSVKTSEVGEATEGEKGVDESHKLSQFIKEWCRKMGAADVGIAELRDYHFYTIGGRRERYGEPVVNNHKYGVAITVEMDYELTMTGPQAPIVMESARQYLRSGMIATQVALTLRNLGFEATTHIDANYDLICPLVAKDAGLGEIGRMGLLMTRRSGPRVRISVVSTSAPLVAGRPVHDDTVLDFCTRCSKCAGVCPSASIPRGDRTEADGGIRWKIDQESCFAYWCQVGTDCGRCMAVCPYSHRDNALHRFVRWGIRNNALFRILAVKMDDIFYGRRPQPKKVPGWIE